MTQFSRVDTASESSLVVELPHSTREARGRIRYDPYEGTSLQLVDRGSLSDLVALARTHYPVLLGELTAGPKVTLIGCNLAPSNFGLTGIADLRLDANELLVGMHLPDPTAKPFDELRVALTGLNDWLGESPIQGSIETLDPSSAGRRFTITCEHLPPFGFSPIGGGPSLLSHQVISPSWDPRTRASIENQFELIVRPRTSFGLDECVYELFRLQAFMSILCGHQVYFQYAQLFLSDEDEEVRQRRVVTYMPRFARPSKRGTARQAGFPLLPLPAIHGDLPTLWSQWTDRSEEYRSAVELFTSTELFGGQLLNFQLLAIMQALETLHRNRFGGVYASDDAYKAIEVALKAAIPSTTADDLSSALKSKLKYGNEYSLRKRLHKLANGLPGGAVGSVGKLVHPSLKEFLSKSVDTRNYLTHYTVELEATAFRNEDLYWATRLLRWFFVAVLLHDIGLPERKLALALMTSDELTHARQSLTKTRPAPGFGIKVETVEQQGAETGGVEPASTAAPSTPESPPPPTPAPPAAASDVPPGGNDGSGYTSDPKAPDGPAGAA